MAQPLQMHQPGVGDLRPDEIQVLESAQPLQINQPGVGDIRLAKRQPLELPQRSEMRNPASVTLEFLRFSTLS